MNLRRLPILLALLTPLLFPAVAHPLEPGVTNVRVKGSDTMQPLIRAWIHSYQKENPAAWMELIYGRGSGNGIASLINGHLEVALSSRPLTDSEKRLAEKRSRTPPVQTPVGLDAVVLVVNRDNPLAGITLEQIGRIYRADGSVERWSDLGVTVPGCDGQRIMRLSRKNSSGTFDMFREWFSGGGRRFHRETYYIETTEDLMEKVRQTPCAMGFGSVSHLPGEVKPLCILGRRGECVAPTEENVRRGFYPMWRYLYLVTLGLPGGATGAFVEWVKGPHGQEVLKKEGFFPLEGKVP